MTSLGNTDEMSALSLPAPRGPITAGLIDAIRAGDPGAVPHTVGPVADPLVDEDLQLALWVLYELHYQGFADVSDDWEWEPELIRLRRELEQQFLDQLRSQVAVPVSALPVAHRLRALVDGDDGPSLSRHLQTRATRPQFLEFLVHRSLYQLKEADPHSWAIPRLTGAAKAALVEIQFDEYGDGDVSRMHSELYRQLLREFALDDSYGAYLDDVPAITLAITNVMSLFGLRRNLRGALAGHLAAYEMTSSAPCRRYAKAVRRFGGSDAAAAFHDVHVTADALHEQVVAHDLCGSLAAADPALGEDVMFGAAACLYVDTRFAEYLFAAWDAGHSALRSTVGSARELEVAS